MYALFTAIPFVGHINPLLRQAEELQQRGWRVALAAHRELTAHAGREAPTVPVVDLGPLGPLADRLRAYEAAASADAGYTRGALRMMPALVDVWPSVFDGVTAALAQDRPDVMVVDLFTSGAMSAAVVAGVPFVVNNPALLPAIPPQILAPAPEVPFVTMGRSIHELTWRDRVSEPLCRHGVIALLALTLNRRLNALRASRGLPRIGFADLLRDRLILVDGVFGLEYARPLPRTVEMVGPMQTAAVPALDDDMARWLAEGPPVVYANLGTVAHASAAQLAKMVEAFSASERRVLWVLRDRFRHRVPAAVPSNVRLVNWVDAPRAILAHPNVRAFVSHCGINSVYESMAAGTPVVGIPMLSDQRDMAVRIADAGVGLWVDKTRFTAAQLGMAIERVCGDPAFRARVVSLQQACVEAGGARRAADLIERESRPAALS